jgi:hypothetical protein
VVALSEEDNVLQVEGSPWDGLFLQVLLPSCVHVVEFKFAFPVLAHELQQAVQVLPSLLAAKVGEHLRTLHALQFINFIGQILQTLRYMGVRRVLGRQGRVELEGRPAVGL